MQKYFSDKQKQQREAKREENRIRNDQKSEMKKHILDLEKLKEVIQIQKSLIPVCLYCERKFANFDHLSFHEQKSKLHQQKIKDSKALLKNKINQKLIEAKKLSSGPAKAKFEEVDSIIEKEEEEEEKIEQNKEVEKLNSKIEKEKKMDKNKKKSNFKIEFSLKS